MTSIKPPSPASQAPLAESALTAAQGVESVASNEPKPVSETMEKADSSQPEKSAGIPAFSFPFSPAAFAPVKGGEQPWHQKSNKSNHHQTPGRAPNGTRRSMGKR